MGRGCWWEQQAGLGGAAIWKETWAGLGTLGSGGAWALSENVNRREIVRSLYLYPLKELIPSCPRGQGHLKSKFVWAWLPVPNRAKA